MIQLSKYTIWRVFSDPVTYIIVTTYFLYHMLETGLLAMTSFTILFTVASFAGALIGTLGKYNSDRNDCPLVEK